MKSMLLLATAGGATAGFLLNSVDNVVTYWGMQAESFVLSTDTNICRPELVWPREWRVSTTTTGDILRKYVSISINVEQL